MCKEIQGSELNRLFGFPRTELNALSVSVCVYVCVCVCGLVTTRVMCLVFIQNNIHYIFMVRTCVKFMLRRVSLSKGLG